MSRNYAPFTGPFAPMCELFVKQKRALGYKYESGYWILRSFDTFSKDYDVQNFSLTKELAQAWSLRRPNEGESHHSTRILEIQHFALFLSRQGYGSYMAPPHLYKRSNHTPYIFTHEEMGMIFKAADEMEPSPYSPLKHLMFPLLYRMLYGCGFRISELLHLLLYDVDTKKGVIHIRHGKNDNERFVPMSPSLLLRCSKYATTVHSGHTPDHPFFFKKDGKPYTVSNIEKHFRDLLWTAGIPYRGKELGPRVHDIRHTFVCHRLNQWALEDADLMALLPILSKYIGHASMSATQWYLRLTAEAYPDITEKMDALTGCVFPEVGGDLL